jgi:hypothetical protein
MHCREPGQSFLERASLEIVACPRFGRIVAFQLERAEIAAIRFTDVFSFSFSAMIRTFSIYHDRYLVYRVASFAPDQQPVLVFRACREVFVTPCRDTFDRYMLA